MAMQRILLIGGSRYFGRHLVTLLRDGGADLTVLNRGSTTPPPGVRHLVADRDDEDGLRAALGGSAFDVVLDQVCYTPLQAALARRVFAGRTGRYVMTSTMEVYDPGTLPGGTPPHPAGPVAEECVDPLRLPAVPGLPWHEPDRVRGILGEARAYAEGKRQAEAVFLGDPALPFVSVRSAHVLGGGRQDFTGRLAHYVGRIRAGLPVAVHDAPYATSFIHHGEIAEVLARVAAGSFTGPVNAASHGGADVRELAGLIGRRVGRAPRYRVVAPGEAASPFSFDRAYAMDNGRGTRLGLGFGEVGRWLPEAVDEAVDEAVAR
jgi:nucleoside-diphosphate-sugar epimerase